MGVKSGIASALKKIRYRARSVEQERIAPDASDRARIGSFLRVGVLALEKAGLY